MILYQLLNPHDPLTFYAENREVAALVVFLLSPMYGAETEDLDEDFRIPIFIFGEPKEWYQKFFGRTPDEGLNALKEKVQKSLRSIKYGSFEKRREYESASRLVPAFQREEFEKQWWDQHTSLSDVQLAAERLANSLATMPAD